METIKYVLMVKASGILLPTFACCECWCDPLFSARRCGVCTSSFDTKFRTNVPYTVRFAISPLRQMAHMEYEQFQLIYLFWRNNFCRRNTHTHTDLRRRAPWLSFSIVRQTPDHTVVSVFVRSKFHFRVTKQFPLDIETTAWAWITWHWIERLDWCTESFGLAQINSMLAYAPNESTKAVGWRLMRKFAIEFVWSKCKCGKQCEAPICRCVCVGGFI